MNTEIVEIDLSGRGKYVKWPVDILERLGTVPDRVIAEELGISSARVSYFRCKQGIESWRTRTRVTPKGMYYYDYEAQRLRRCARRQARRGLQDDLTYEQWEFACEWFDDCCAYCGKEALLGEDHLVPLSKGGPRTVLNVIPCCKSCNSSKRDALAQDWIYWKFGRVEGQEIIDDVVVYLREALGF